LTEISGILRKKGSYCGADFARGNAEIQTVIAGSMKIIFGGICETELDGR